MNSNRNLSNSEAEGRKLVWIMLWRTGRSHHYPFETMLLLNTIDLFKQLLMRDKYEDWDREFPTSEVVVWVLGNPRLWSWAARDYQNSVKKRYGLFIVSFIAVCIYNQYLAGFIPYWLFRKQPDLALLALFCAGSLYTLKDVPVLIRWRRYEKAYQSSANSRASEVSVEGVPIGVLRVMWWVTPRKQRRDAIADFKDDFELVKEDLGLEGAQKWARGEAVKTVGEVLRIWLKGSVVGSLVAGALHWIRTHFGI